MATHGITQPFILHPDRVKERKPQIAVILDQMPDEFHRSKGGGWTFLNLALTKAGEHWAEHPTIELLVVLAITSGQGGYLMMPRELWAAFPGGMPYVWFDSTKA